MAGQPLVMVPGLLCSARLYAPQVSALQEIADIVVADHTRHDTIADIARSILAAAPERFALCGLSMGGYISFEIMRQARERVSRLALLDTSARPEMAATTERRKTLMAMARNGQFASITRDHLLALLIHPDRLDDEPLTSTIIAMADDIGAAAFLRQQRAIMSRADSRPGLAEITCPTLVMVGDGDQLTPPDHAREIASGIPAARLEIIPDCGHLSTLERPDTVNRALADWVALPEH